MNVEQFRALCHREWDDGYGDVFALILAPGSHRELTDGVAADGTGSFVPFPLRIRTGEAPSALLTEAVNPVTRTTVTVTGSGKVPYDLCQVTKRI